MSWGVGPKPFIYAAHFLGIVSVVFVFIWTIYWRGGINYNAADTNLIFNVHPVLMLLSLVFLAGESILAYKTVPGSKQFKKTVHLVLHLIALVLGIVGVCAAFKYHNLNSIANLYSLHSWLGLITIIFFGIQWLLGFVSFFYPGFTPGARKSYLPWHVFVGFFIYALAIASTETGFLEKLTFLESGSTIERYSSEAMFVNVTGLIVLLFGAFVFLGAAIPVEQADDGYNLID